MHYNSFIGKEDVDTEFKELCMVWEKDYRYDQCIELLRTGKWIFNDSIENTIAKYFEKYLPKYVVSFTHRLTESVNSSLYIGIDDEGHVRGIPYSGELNINSLNRIASNVIDNLILCFNEKTLEKIKKSLIITVIPIIYNNSSKRVENEQYIECISSIKETKKTIGVYRNLKTRWYDCFKSQTEKLCTILNRDKERCSYIDYVKPTLRKTYKHTYSHLFYLCDVPSYYDLLVDLKTKQFEPLDKGKMREYHTIAACEKTEEPHYNINKIIIFYLFGRYKDYCIDSIKKFKPIKKRTKLNLKYPQFLLSQINKMLPIWMNNNIDLKLYVIKIDIPNGILNDDENIMYFNEKKRKYSSCYRSNSEGGPTTIHC